MEDMLQNSEDGQRRKRLADERINQQLTKKVEVSPGGSMSRGTTEELSTTAKTSEETNQQQNIFERPESAGIKDKEQ